MPNKFEPRPPYRVEADDVEGYYLLLDADGVTFARSKSSAVAHWIAKMLNEAQAWDQKIEKDVAAGHLDPLAAEAVADVREGRVGSTPPDKIAHGTPSASHPTIVCLVGSTRFYEAFVQANFEETLAGRIVLSVTFSPGVQEHGQQIRITPEQKVALDKLCLCKIDLADEILVLNVGGYVGESTREEIEYARRKGKTLRWLVESETP